MQKPTRQLWLIADLVAVLVFVAIGRRSHDESGAITGFLRTLWPFAAAVVIGWLLARAWRDPLRIAPTGLAVWIVTVAGGMLLRAASGQGTAFSFIVVATVFLGLFLLGWRFAAGKALRPGEVPGRSD